MAKSFPILSLIGMAFAVGNQALANEQDAWTQGTWHLNLRYRFEHVDDNVNRNAKASTLRAALGYRSAEVSGFSLVAELEHVSVVGKETFNDGGANGKERYALVADPKGTEINQAYIQFTGIPGTTMRYGRQEITHRPTPFHRYLGNVLWRQNHQSYDGFHLRNSSLEGLTINAGYIHNVNRIFGEENPLPNRSDHDLEALLGRAVYSTGGPDIEAYAYDLDFSNAVSLSTRTFGVRMSGEQAVGEAASLIYALEGASQKDTGSNPRDDLSLRYWMVDAGVKLPNWRNLTLKVTHEVQEGDGRNGFRTPLATLHAYQGWTDKFLATPPTGLKDTYVTAIAKIGRLSLTFAWHEFSAEKGSFDYGREWGLMATTQIQDRFTLGLKFANYEADNNAMNVGDSAADATRVWGWVQFAL